MEIAISTSVGRGDSLEQVMRQIADGGFRCVEAGYYHLADHNDVATVAELASRLGLAITTLHLPFRQLDISSPDESVRQSSFNILRDFIIEMAENGLKTAIVHPNSYAKAKDRAELRLRSDQAIKTLTDLAEIATERGVYLAVENMTGIEMRGGCDIAGLRQLVDQLNCEYVGLCVDTVHANMNGFDPKDEIHQAGSRLMAIHASDSINRGHDHLVPNRGELNWDEIIASLAHVDYPGVFTMEVYGPRESSLSTSEELIRAAYERGSAFQKMWNELRAVS